MAFYLSEVSATIACNATAEKERLEKFSTVDAIAVPHLKLDLERDRREYRHVPLLNVSTREMEEDMTVILGGDIELNDLAHEVITTCLKRSANAPFYGKWSNVNVGWEYYWDIIRAMELDPSEENVHNTIFKLQNAYEIGCLIDIIMLNTRMPRPLLTIVDEDSMTKLKANKWDRAVLVRVMKDVDPRMEGLLTACAIAWITASLSSAVIRTILWTKNGSVRSDFAWEAILRMWDFELWRPLPDDVEWSEEKRNGVECICRKKRFRAKPEYKVRGYDYKWVWLDVDENGETLDTPENQEWKEWIQEEQTEEEQVEGDQVEKESRSPFIRFLRKLNL
ncbi:hypothetical protein FRC17_000536 [Serendipita sp. 399]|nr:hypothetical protein FRC17_000536 [Serendipita sp. 399]